MAFSQNFSVSQVTGYPSQIVLTDTSTGSDGSIASRRVYLAKADGTFLVPAGTSTQYITWAYANASITIDALDKDYALLITVQWLDAGGAILYALNSLNGETLYNETFDYLLTQMMASNPYLVNDNDFFPNKSLLRTFIDAGNQAITL
ncbi:MAG: hypothetical protein KGI27_13295, partial [Thaumarchaeota archaeon]|nr:hypothetical protein [Nitrososphaerota archaeon]